MSASQNPAEENHETPEEQPELGEALPEAEEELSLEDIRAEYEAKLAEAKDQTLRAMAETENVRRRAQRDVEETSKYAVTGLARDLLTVAENLYLALGAIPEDAREEEGLLKTLADGVDMTLRDLLSTFERQGIKRIDPLGEKFDHNRHQAVSQIEDPVAEPNTVIHVMQAGYVIGDRLLRPAMVVVSKQGDASQKVNTQV